MAKQTVNIGTSANKGNGDPLRTAFTKINNNFDELYSALGSDGDLFDPNSVDQSLVPTTTNTVDLGSASKQWRSLYVSNNTIYIGGVAIGVDGNGNLTTGGTVVGSTPAWANITGKPTFATVATTGAYADLTGKPTIPTSFDRLVNGAHQFVLNVNGAGPWISFPESSSSQIQIQGTDIIGIGFEVQLISSEDGVRLSANATATNGPRRDWQFGTDGILTLPQNGIIKSDTDIDITIDTPDSSTFNWQFGADGTLTLPEDAVVKTISGNLTIEGESYVIIDSATNGQIDIGRSSGVGAVSLGSKSNGTNVVVDDLFVANGVYEFFSSLADATGVVTHNCANGHIFYHTSPDANWTVNLTNLLDTYDRATSVTLIIAQGGTGYIPNTVQIAGVAQTINWQGNVTPTPSTNRTDVVTFSIINNSGTYIVLGQLTGF